MSYIYKLASVTKQNINLNGYVCKVASVDEVPRSVDVVEHTIECLHVWITSSTTATHRCNSIVSVHLNAKMALFRNAAFQLRKRQWSQMLNDIVEPSCLPRSVGTESHGSCGTDILTN